MVTNMNKFWTKVPMMVTIFFFCSFLVIFNNNQEAYIVLDENKTRTVNISPKNSSKSHIQPNVTNYEFKDFESEDTVTHHMVCITYVKQPERELVKGIRGPVWLTGGNNSEVFEFPGRVCRHKHKIITVYKDTEEKTEQTIGSFTVTFKPLRELPESYQIIENQTAYFLANPFTFEPLNFFHFTRQIYFPLYWMIMSTNQLHTTAQNIVFYPRPYAYCVVKDYIPIDIHRYQFFRDILHIRNKDKFGIFTDQPQPDKVCYKNAVFTVENFVDKAAMAIEYFKRQIGVTEAQCTDEKEVLTIIDRKKYRRILNVAQLKEVGDSLDYETKVVYLETLSLHEQAQLMHCSKVLVGVTGAGLQWAFFMKDHSGVVEIAWPHKSWDFFFTGTGDYDCEERDIIRPLNFVPLSNVTCQLNPQAPGILLEDLFHQNKNIPYHIAMAILKDKRNYDPLLIPSHNVGKLCDIIVDPLAFRNAVIAAAKSK